MRAQIIGTGSCLPEKIVTNDFLSTIVETSDEWISSRTGIRQRHIAINETTASMSTEAGKKALESAGVKAEDLDLIIVATCTPDTLVPNTACLVQSELGAVNAVAFDISAACSGFVFALNMVDAYMQAGIYKTALVIGDVVPYCGLERPLYLCIICGWCRCSSRARGRARCDRVHTGKRRNPRRCDLCQKQRKL